MARFAWDNRSYDCKILRYNETRLQKKIKKLLDSDNAEDIEKCARLMHIQALLIKTKNEIQDSEDELRRTKAVEEYNKLQQLKQIIPGALEDAKHLIQPNL